MISLVFPGPIFQYEYACRHGAIVRPESAKGRSMAIKKSVWDEYQARFGGGPLVPCLELCTECLVSCIYITSELSLTFFVQESELFTHCPYNLEQLSTRRTQETDKVFQVNCVGQASITRLVHVLYTIITCTCIL